MNVQTYPFPYVVLDGAWEARLLRKARRELNPSPAWHGFNNEHELKLGAPFSAGGHYTSVVKSILKSDEWICPIEEAFGFESHTLTFDDIGGGCHWIPTGGKLDVHIDFNEHNGLYRRVNCLVYLNEGWAPGDGGELELWASKDGPCVVKIEPVFNRTVLFMTGESSYHGHPEPLVKGPRVSFAAYYFHPSAPDDFVGSHSTVWAS